MTSSGDEGWQRPAPTPYEPYQPPSPNAQPTMPLPPPDAGPPPGPLTEGYNGPAFRAAQPTNQLARIALILSLLLITAPAGAILGHRARTQIEQTRENGDGLALAAIIVGWTVTGLALLLCCAGLIWLGVSMGTSRVT